MELIGHVVEGAAQHGELVAPAHGHALLQASLRDRVRGAHERAQRAHDRAALDVGDAGDEQEGGEQAEEQAVPRGVIRRVDQRLRRERRQAAALRVAE